MLFTFSIGGPLGTSYGVELVGDELRCTRFQGFESFSNKTFFISVRDNPAWESLLRFLASCKWRGSYEEPLVLDGTSWELVVELGEIQLHTEGQNAYPKRFQQFLKLLNKVFGLEELTIA